ncbi:MAG: hypothetical protein HY298_19465 [Verrucomicrobia bacterium]|nr:hypothetical protein [Verrucomicrobiota bacterium]
MKKTILIGMFIAIAGFLATARLLHAQEKSIAPKYEYAVVKWDGPDRIYYNLPDKFELVRLSKEGTNIPNDAQGEEFCLSVASNKMAKEGWEAVNLDSRRILFRRVANK